MIANGLSFNLVRSLGFGESDELYWSYATLMKELEETVLSVCARLAEVNNSTLVVNMLTLYIYSFSITLHIELLDMRCKFG